jgi:hypothetical protein
MIYGLLALLAHATPIHHYACLFPRLSKAKIFLNNVVHTKNASLNGTLFLQMFFQENEALTGRGSA